MELSPKISNKVSEQHCVSSSLVCDRAQPFSARISVYIDSGQVECDVSFAGLPGRYRDTLRVK